MKRPPLAPRATDDAALKQATGKDRKAWFAAIDKAGVEGRSAVGKFLLAEKVDAWWITTLTVEYEAAKGLVEKDGRPKGYSLCVTKTVAAPVDRAFEAFTTTRDLDRWFGPGTRVKAEPGGALENSDGNRATFTKVRPGKAVVLSWDTPGFGAASQIEVLFQPKGQKTGLVVNHTRVQGREDADALRAAWEEALSRLKTLLEA